MNYAITGASGNNGSKIAEKLLQEGHHVKVIARNREHLRNLIHSGAEPCMGDLLDEEFLSQVFKDIDGVFAMIPPDLKAEDYRRYQGQVAKSLAWAIRSNSVPFVVALSSVGADLAQGTGVVLGLHDMEEIFRKELTSSNILFLRPAFFMENLLGQLELIRNMGIMGGAVKGDLRFPMIATQDIANFAAKRLLKCDFRGADVQYLLGSRDVSFDEAASLMGNALGIPGLKYVEFNYAETMKSMQKQGMSESAAMVMVNFMEAINIGLVHKGLRRTPENTTPTTLEEFVQTAASVYNLSQEKDITV